MCTGEGHDLRTGWRATSALLSFKVNPAAIGLTQYCVIFKANLTAVKLKPKLKHRRGYSVDGDDTRISKCEIQWRGASGRRGLGRLHPRRETDMKSMNLGAGHG